MKSNKGLFLRFAERTASWTGHPAAFVVAVLSIVVWAAIGPAAHFSERWILTIECLATIITFLMVFLIQNLQNRDTRALHIKLDELIRATEGAHTSLLGVHDLTEKQLKELSDKYKAIAVEAQQTVMDGGDDTGMPEVEMMIVDTILAEPDAEKLNAN